MDADKNEEMEQGDVIRRENGHVKPFTEMKGGPPPPGGPYSWRTQKHVSAVKECRPLRAPAPRIVGERFYNAGFTPWAYVSRRGLSPHHASRGSEHARFV